MAWRRLLVGATSVLLVGVAGCSGSESVSDPVVFGTEQGLPGAAGTLPSPEQQAGTQAIKAIPKYFSERVALESDPGADLSRLERVAGQPMLDVLRREIETWRSHGVVGQGSVNVVGVTVSEVVAPKDEFGTPIPGKATASLRVCVDWSGHDRKNRDGVSVVDPDRPDAVLSKPSMENLSWPDPSGWKVVFDQVWNDTPRCDSP